MAELNLVDPLDEASGDYPKHEQIACMARKEPSSNWFCILPAMHSGDHVAGPYRWSRS